MTTPIREISELAEDEPSFDITGDLCAWTAAEDQHFWHRTRNRIIADRLLGLGIQKGARLLDMGSGTGSVTAYLAARGFDVVGVEGHRKLVEMAAKRAPSVRFWLHDLRRGTAELPERDFHVVGLFDVIEHLETPERALSDALGCIRPGGFVVGTVPALMLLWSAVDLRAGHKMRYSRASLRSLLSRVEGAEIVEIAPFNRSLVPLLFVQRTLASRKPDALGTRNSFALPPWPLNRALHELVMAEHRLARFLDKTPLEGASLWFALRKA